MSVVWIGLALLAAAILDGWLILRHRQHVLPASLQDRLSRFRRTPFLTERLASPISEARLPKFILGMFLMLAGFWLFGRGEPYIRLPRLAAWFDHLLRLGLPPTENTLIGTAALLWGGALLVRSLRPLQIAEPLSVPVSRLGKPAKLSELAQAGLLTGALLPWAILLRLVRNPGPPIPLTLGLWLGSLACAAAALLAHDRNRRGHPPPHPERTGPDPFRG